MENKAENTNTNKWDGGFIDKNGSVYPTYPGPTRYIEIKTDDTFILATTLMENKTSYTFDDAISEVSKKYGVLNWTFLQAAELYKSKATEELRNALTQLQDRFNDSTTKFRTEVEELRKDNEVLHIMLHDNISEIERLKDSNKELVEASKGLVNEITQPGYPLHSGMTIVWIDNIKKLIK